MIKSNEQAKAWLANLLQGNIEKIEPHPDGGWNFTAINVQGFGSDVVKNADSFNYCFLESENEEEVGKHRETMMFERGGEDSGCTLIIEGYYERAMGNERQSADAIFDGRAVLAKPEELEAMQRSMSHSFSCRTLDYQITSLLYVTEGLRTTKYFCKQRFPDSLRDRLMAQVKSLNQVVMELTGAGDAA